MSKKKVAILISGRGSNMEALIKACQDVTFPASVELVISNKKEAYGLEIAQSYGIHTQSLNRKNFQNDHEFDSKISTVLKENNIQTFIPSSPKTISSRAHSNPSQRRTTISSSTSQSP